MAKRIDVPTRKRLDRESAWKALAAHYKKVRDLHLRQLFADDPRRADRMSVETAGLYFDYSKNLITEETLQLLIRLAEECGLQAWESEGPYLERNHERRMGGTKKGWIRLEGGLNGRQNDDDEEQRGEL